jgi:hypothetical protein
MRAARAAWLEKNSNRPAWHAAISLSTERNRAGEQSRRDSLADFNDGCQDFAELWTLVEQARARAMNDTVRAEPTRPRPGVASSELVMA